MSFTSEQVHGFSEAAQSLKLYRRAELFDETTGQQLIADLYEDPLPHDAVLSAILKANTTFLVGRKGTGKSTIFQQAQATLRQRKGVVSAYLDIKTLFEESQVDTSVLAKLSGEVNALPQPALEKLLIYRGFIISLLDGIREELRKKLKESLWASVKESFTGTIEELFEDLDALIREAKTDKFINVVGAARISVRNKTAQKEHASTSVDVGVDEKGPSAKVAFNDSAEASSEGEKEFSDLLLRTFNLKELLLALKILLDKSSIRHLFIFIDDFSELPEDAMKIVVDTLLAPLNNWSEEFIKLKIAAYPSRVYFGQIDRTKVDEFYLDIFQLYGSGDVNTMEVNAAEFVRRLVTSRCKHFCNGAPETYFETVDEELWRALFFASMGNPRTLGYILFFLYESSIIYERKIGLKAIRDASRKFYEEKLEPYFQTSKFLHQSFAERSSIFSLKELLEKVVVRARDLRTHRESQIMREIEGRPPTSHFHVIREYEQIFSTLELNFFISRYFEMSDRDGRKVVVYALNYGLCQKFAIEFGRPMGKREFRAYFVERVFDYSSIVKAHIEANQEIACDACEAVFGMEQLQTLKLYGMLCPRCRKGTCNVSNLSKKYEATLRAVSENLLLPATELGILRTLHTEKKPLYAAAIAEELDCSHQLIGRRGKHLAERGLVARRTNEDNRREFSITEAAEKSYFKDEPNVGLNVSDGSGDPETSVPQTELPVSKTSKPRD